MGKDSAQLMIVSWAALFVLLAALPASRAADWLEQPTRRVQYPVPVSQQGEAPKWIDKGFLLARSYWTLANDPRPNLTVYGPDGGKVSETRIWFPDAVRVHVDGVSMYRDGTALAATSSLSGDGRLACALVRVAPPGQVVQVIRTDPFCAMRVAAAPDGAIWAFGRTPFAGKHEDPEVFQRYSSDGQLLGKFLPRSTFRTSAGHPDGGRSPSSILAAADDRICAYSDPAGEWIEFDLDGRLLGRWQVRAPEVPSADGRLEPARIMSLAVTESGEAYATVVAPNYAGLHALNRSAMRWEPAPGTSRLYEQHRLGRLYGADGEQLILSDPAALSALGWFSPSR